MSTLAQQIEKLELMLNNATAILAAFNEANFADVSFAEIQLTNSDGSTTTYNLPSNLNIDRKIKALQTTVDALTSLGDSGQSIVVSVADPSARQVYVSDFERAYKQLLTDEYVVATELSIKQNGLFEALSDPICRVQVQLPAQFSHVQFVRVKKYVLSASSRADDFTNSGITTADNHTTAVQKLLNAKYSYVEYDDVVKLDGEKLRYYGNFSVLSTSLQSNGDLLVRLDKRTYNDSDSAVDNSREISIGDILGTSDGQAIYEIVNINLVNGVFVTLRRKGGFKSVTTGIDTLYFLDQSDLLKNVSIPIEGGERSFVFFAPVNPVTGISGEWSQAIPVSSASYEVVSDGVAVSFDEFYNTNVLAVGKFIISQVSSQGLSRGVALDIEKPVLDRANFDVVQINTHLSKTGDFDKIKRLQEDKNNTQAKIESIKSEISDIQNRLARATYPSDSAKKQEEALLTSKQQAASNLSKKLITTIKEINTVASTTSAAKVSPKYRIRGFWPVIEPTDDDGSTQRIVAYDIRYKYVPSNSSASVSQSVSEIDGISGSYSPWTEVTSNPLAKVYNPETDKYEWEENDISNAEKNNINQLDIPITYGESVIIQVRAISEAGYPSNPAKSEFSDALRIEFPTSLAQDETISAIVTRNAEDEQIVKLDEFLENQGVNKHIEESYELADKFYAHKASSIDSEFKVDGVTQSLYEKIVSMDNRIQLLEETVLRQTVSWSIEVLDEEGNAYPVANRQQLKVFAGYYTDNVNINDVANYGNVVTKKLFLRVTNNSARAGDILTLSAGNLTARTTDSLYSSAPFQTFTQGLQFPKNGQIFYLRNQDLTGAESLYVTDTTTVTNQVTPADINTGAASALKNVVSWDGIAPNVVALNGGANSTGYVSMLKTHPIYAQYNSNPNAANLQALSDEFSRVANYTNIIRGNTNQRDYDSLIIDQFLDDDKYLVGADSCGAMLFTRPQTQSSTQVETSDSTSPFVVQGGSSVTIPIIFQYRMTDAVGRLNGDGTKSLAGANLTYTKKIGIDLFAGSEIKFDLEVSASFRPTVQSGSSSVDSTPITSSGTNTNLIL